MKPGTQYSVNTQIPPPAEIQANVDAQLREKGLNPKHWRALVPAPPPPEDTTGGQELFRLTPTAAEFKRLHKEYNKGVCEGRFLEELTILCQKYNLQLINHFSAQIEGAEVVVCASIF